MKIVKITAIIFLIVITEGLLGKRVERKSQTKAKGDGSGSWETQYECPGIQLLEQNGNWSQAERVTFKANQIVKPDDSQKLGIYFSMTGKPSGALASILKPSDKPNNYYLPYRSVSAKFSYNNPFYDYKILEGSVTADNSKTFSFKLNLPYKSMGWYIDNNQMQTLCDRINDNRTGHQTIVNSGKATAITAAGVYILNKPLLEKASSEGADLKNLEEESKQKETNLKTQIETSNKNLETLKKEIAELEAKLIEKKTKYATDNNNLNSLGAQLQGIQQNIETITKNSKAKETLRADLDKKVTDSARDFKAAIEVLIKEVPENTKDLQTAQTEVLEKKSDEALKKSLNNIYS